jgi:hypothetical protein
MWPSQKALFDIAVEVRPYAASVSRLRPGRRSVRIARAGWCGRSVRGDGPAAVAGLYRLMCEVPSRRNDGGRVYGRMRVVRPLDGAKHRRTVLQVAAVQGVDDGGPEVEIAARCGAGCHGGREGGSHATCSSA